MGFALSAVLFFLLGVLLVRLTQLSGINEMDTVLIPWEIPWLRKTVGVIEAGDRRLFVPVLAVRVRYANGRGEPLRETAAFMIGVERPGQDRLAPLPLDRGDRTIDRLAIRVFEG